jgi:outer membrane receptor for ferrienterochelin and colicin
MQADNHLSLSRVLLIIIIALQSNCGFGQIQDTLMSPSRLKKLSLEELMNIKVVTASGSEQPINEAPSTMIVITEQQIQERGYEQLDDVLRDIPGVDLVHTYGNAPTFITFREMYGDENRRVLFMI